MEVLKMNYGSDTYKQWLKSLKAGDEVAIRYHNSSQYELATVDRVTSTGKVRVGIKLFSPNGVCMVKGTGFIYYLEPVTDYVRESIKRDRLLKRIDSVNFNDLSTDVLEEIVKILERVEDGSCVQ
jgi:hypothetical protein